MHKKLRIRMILISLFVGSSLVMASLPAHAASSMDTGIATSTSLMWTDDDILDDRLRDIKNLGANWVRIEFNWSEIQPDTRDEYMWGSYDRVVDAVHGHDLDVLVTLAYTPSWAQNENCALLVESKVGRTRCSPANTEDFARFARAVVIRYRDRVHTWEIWNEPNVVGYWKTVNSNNHIRVDPEAYARTATAAASEIRRYDPNAFIITGGLAPMFEPRASRGMRQSDYLAQLLPNLDADLFSAVGIHPYSWPKSPMLAADYNAFYTVDNGDSDFNLRSIMQQHGWGDKQIWATEFGSSTQGDLMAGLDTLLGRSRPDHVSEEMQAEILQQGMAAWSTKRFAGPMFVHADSDQWLMDHKNEGGFGLRRSDGSKKPAYDIFRNQSHIR